jgi:protein O-GlcNAc transferase
MAPGEIQQTFNSALQHHQAGRLREAENLYRQVLAQQPTHFGAMHLLGVIAYQAGRYDVAVDLIRRAIALRPDFAEAHSNLGNALKDSGRLDEAIAAFRQALSFNPNLAQARNNLGNALMDKGQLDEAIAAFHQAIALRPDYAEAHTNLGNALKEKGQLDEAVAAYRRAIALNPNLPGAYCNLGEVLREKGQLDEAIAACKQAIALNPNLPEAFGNLGNALRDKGQFDEAITALRRAIALDPKYAQAHSNLGIALRDKGHLDEAISAFRRAIALGPNYAEAHTNLGNTLKEKGQLDEAIAAHRHAIALRPTYAEAHNNLSIALREQGRLDEAITACQKAITLRPGYAEAHNNLANALKKEGQLDESIAACQEAITLKPGYAEAHNNLGNALKDEGRLDEAIAAYRQAIALNPNLAGVPSNLLFSLQYHAGYDPGAIAEEHRAWNRQYAEPLKQFIQPHMNDRDPNRPLRIGYVSADLRDHSISRFLLPLFRRHNHDAYQIVCFSDVSNEDRFTNDLRACADKWHKTVGDSDERVADKIREDRIDILVDLAGHTAGNRLLVFARKPAPVQVAYLGYPGSTGLTEMDYHLSDVFADPPGKTESLHSEKLWRLPVCNWCFDEPVDAPPVLLSRAAGPICFGTFNNFTKASDAVMDLWAAILQATPSSRLIIKSRGLGEQSVRRRISEFFQSRDIPPDRLEIRGGEPNVRSHLEVYNQVDIALDSYPYHGTTTTCEALWMGVPVVSLAGTSHVSRVGASLLNAVSLPEMVAQSTQEYVSIATSLAGDLPRLTELRRTLRDRMRASPLMDAPRFARDIEAAYRRMWQIWCGISQKSEGRRQK